MPTCMYAAVQLESSQYSMLFCFNTDLMFVAHFLINIMILCFEITLRAFTQLSSFSRISLLFIFIILLNITHLSQMCVIFTPAFCSHYMDTGIRRAIVVMFLFQTFIIHFIISRRICWDRCGRVVACCDASLKCYNV